jgi:translation initiation factor IF-1
MRPKEERKEERTKTDSTQTGVIEVVLPRAMYRVRLNEDRLVRVGVDAVCQGSLVKLIAGDRVEVRLAARDPSRGQIVRKL